MINEMIKDLANQASISKIKEEAKTEGFYQGFEKALNMVHDLYQKKLEDIKQEQIAQQEKVKAMQEEQQRLDDIADKQVEVKTNKKKPQTAQEIK